MGSIYSDWGLSRNKIGECDDGYIYKGWGIDRERIGEYSDGSIYSDWGISRNKIGEYEDGYIYKGWGIDRERIGEYQDGYIYKGWGLGKERVGEYEGNPAGAAAFLLLSFNSSSGSDSNTGCLGTIFTLLWGIISFVFVVIIPFLFVYIWLPEVLGLSLVGYLFGILVVLCASSGVLPLAYIFVIPVAIIQLLFYVYWLLVIIVKVKTRCSKKAMLKLFWKWFLKGPLAYPMLIDIMNENNIMPKTTAVLKKLNNWFSNIFKKKTND